MITVPTFAGKYFIYLSFLMVFPKDNVVLQFNPPGGRHGTLSGVVRLEHRLLGIHGPGTFVLLSGIIPSRPTRDGIRVRCSENYCIYIQQPTPLAHRMLHTLRSYFTRANVIFTPFFVRLRNLPECYFLHSKRQRFVSLGMKIS